MRARRQIPVVQPVPAVERARQAWANMARETRTELRSIGVVGDMRHISDVAGQSRGAAVPRGLFALAEKMRDAGVPMDEATERLSHTARMIAAMAYHDGPNPAA